MLKFFDVMIPCIAISFAIRMKEQNLSLVTFTRVRFLKNLTIIVNDIQQLEVKIVTF